MAEVHVLGKKMSRVFLNLIAYIDEVRYNYVTSYKKIRMTCAQDNVSFSMLYNLATDGLKHCSGIAPVYM